MLHLALQLIVYTGTIESFFDIRTYFSIKHNRVRNTIGVIPVSSQHYGKAELTVSERHFAHSDFVPQYFFCIYEIHPLVVLRLTAVRKSLADFFKAFFQSLEA